ncbi:adenosylcobinamide kinase /adenosylcobinamide-phosphate guanylyltransferase [Andreprevotia lacus DSM 23236]|jgi:adenosylcobinamide kinase/adenosylcobinamide-phosphate guanylyltransferase|uniref:Bifunctional adenosylcobalamin biosynthesis protein n=1 Tax=Andreprevotia lacus DSM 23236 TaxID=1121001 RepID=A0A1W1XRW5_9NEIS|nr:bifunctional adenosylcobinamide kinase/adenosylcobinamide-phosphate guanylyltransferase [Andreprevotia lacus]SMC26592.1 adenosylcobinamide kinase /adenosylcobinamide-phosphate guanylyltransferase [Andreprevotia lacus DSM 23236]
MSITLILGGARSGKSRHAEQLAQASGKAVTVIATATAGDAEMAARIVRHRQDRPAQWQVVEEPCALGSAILHAAAPDRLVLVDCLTLWLANTLFGSDSHAEDAIPAPSPLFEHERSALLAALAQATGDVVLVSNEIGLGVVPLGAGNRLFVDEAGRLNQAVAAASQRVFFIAAGLALPLKG